jgi:23S rRNA pseudoU1915 N3-methylase RlmH
VQLQLTHDFPVYYKHQVYFLSSVDARKVFTIYLISTNRKEFILHPVKYTSIAPAFVNIPTIVPNVYVIGTSKSGKTTLANQLAAKLGAIRLTMPKALRLIISSSTSLGKQVTNYSELLLKIRFNNTCRLEIRYQKKCWPRC